MYSSYTLYQADHIKTVRGVGYIFAHPRDHAKGPTAKAEEA